MMEAFIVSKAEKELVYPAIPPEILAEGNLVLGCVDQKGTVCGAAVFCEQNANIRLLYIYVAESYRRKGAGSEMMDLAERIGRSISAIGIEVNFFLEDDTRDSYAFFRAIGFSADDEPRKKEYLTTVKSFSENISRKAVFKNMVITKLSDLSDRQFRLMTSEVEKNMKEGEFVRFHPRECYDGDLSFAAFKDNRIVGGIMIRALGEEAMEVSYLWVSGKGNSVFLLGLLQKALFEAEARLTPDMPVRMIGYTPEGENLIRKLSGSEVRERMAIRMLLSI